MADYGGFDLGLAVSVDMVPNPSAEQVTEYFGLTGLYSLWGGGRGRLFPVRGLIVGPDRFAVDAARGTLLSYADGIGRVLTDTGGVSWPAVVFTGQFRGTGEPRYQFGPGFCAYPYEAVFRGNL